MRTMPALAVAAILTACTSTPAVHADKSFVADSSAPACRALTPALTGGPMPPDGILAIRRLGTTNFELAYGGQVILLGTLSTSAWSRFSWPSGIGYGGQA